MLHAACWLLRTTCCMLHLQAPIIAFMRTRLRNSPIASEPQIAYESQGPSQPLGTRTAAVRPATRHSAWAVPGRAAACGAVVCRSLHVVRWYVGVPLGVQAVRSVIAAMIWAALLLPIVVPRPARRTCSQRTYVCTKTHRRTRRSCTHARTHARTYFRALAAARVHSWR
jgi:hypothetical protein